MINIDPQQELFTRLKLNIQELGYDVYDGGLPPDGTPYPFIYLGDCQQDDTMLKNAICGSVYQTIHIWSNNPHNRGTVSSMLSAVKNICRQIEHTDNYSWLITNINQRIVADNTTNKPLLHGILEVDYKYS